jgi:hypothetical protein
LELLELNHIPRLQLSEDDLRLSEPLVVRARLEVGSFHASRRRHIGSASAGLRRQHDAALCTGGRLFALWLALFPPDAHIFVDFLGGMTSDVLSTSSRENFAKV